MLLADLLEPALALVPEVPVEAPDLLEALRLEPEADEEPEDMLLPLAELLPLRPCEPAAIIEAFMLLPGSFVEEEPDLDPAPIEALAPEVPDD